MCKSLKHLSFSFMDLISMKSYRKENRTVFAFPGGVDAARDHIANSEKRGICAMPESCAQDQSCFNSSVSSGNVTQDAVCSFSAFLRLLNRHESQMAI